MRRQLALTALLIALPLNTLAFTEEVSPSEWVNDLSPIDTDLWNYDRAAHLLERAGFGGLPEEIEQLAMMTPQEAVRHLVYFESISNNHLDYGPFWSRNSGGPKNSTDSSSTSSMTIRSTVSTKIS